MSYATELALASHVIHFNRADEADTPADVKSIINFQVPEPKSAKRTHIFFAFVSSCVVNVPGNPARQTKAEPARQMYAFSYEILYVMDDAQRRSE